MSKITPEIRFALTDLIADCAHALDDDKLESWPDYFLEDGTYKIISRENHEANMELGLMSCDGRGMMHDRILALRTANVFEPHTYCHLLGATRVKAEDGADNIYLARTNFSVIRTMQDGRQTRYATGKYVDTCELRQGVARFRSRLVILESRQIDVLMVIPL